jgi:hypothetical protein
MLIANPIYDIMFKRLMEDLPIARFFIETLIGETIEELVVKPQEYRYKPNRTGKEFDEAARLMTVYKLDYIATIKTAEGEHKKVLIEVQKARNSVDVMRFRNYLAEQYKLEDEVTVEGGKITKPLPIITIYLLGFKLNNIDCAAVKIERKYIDMLLGTEIDLKNEFIEQLTHNSYIVQIPRINSRLQNRLDELLSVFEQQHFLDEKGTIKEYSHPIQTPAIRRMIELLNLEGADPERRKEIEDEIEAWKIIEGGNRQLFDELRLQIEHKDLQIRAIAEAREADKVALEEKNKALEAQEKELEALRKLLAEKG